MRIIGGAWRGRRLVAPAGEATRPTAERMRQAIFDMLLHAAWGGAGLLRDAAVLDAFAGTGAMGLEALSRGAGEVVFMEFEPTALASLRANIAACRAEQQARIMANDVLAAPRGTPCRLAFLDPPYGQNLLPAALDSLRARGWIVPGTLVIAESGAREVAHDGEVLAQRRHGAARVTVWREQ